MANVWTNEEVKLLRHLKLDPVQNQPEKLCALVKHFTKPNASIFAITEGESKTELKVSKGLARKVRDLIREGKLDWLAQRSSGGARDRTGMWPGTPFQEEARNRCREGDHSWMSSNSPFAGHAFTEEIRLESSEETEQDPPDEQGRPIRRQTFTCYFCGYEKILRWWAIF